MQVSFPATSPYGFFCSKFSLLDGIVNGLTLPKDPPSRSRRLSPRNHARNALPGILTLGAGAWSLPLVAHAKKLGTKGIHLGGSLQLLFGIKGGRFDSNQIYNESWTRPLPSEVPANFKKMEQGACW